MRNENQEQMKEKMSMHLYNFTTKRKEQFIPIDETNVRMYACGPTVHSRAHVGNIRPAIVFDVLYRLLRHEYGADHVTYARNFTDVDDKINTKSIETGRSIRDITDETIAWYHEDINALNILRPDHEPRATDYINEIFDLTDQMIENGHAYESDGHVFFDVKSMKNYGEFSGRIVPDDEKVDARKRNPGDFVVWKPSPIESGLPGWESQFGRVRPGWHSECVAMSTKLLGTHFDIHCGGIDLVFPHHEGEIAQAHACGHKFANYWLHNGHVKLNDQKMSKSIGNVYTIPFLFQNGVTGDEIRLMMLLTHYRSPIEWSNEKLENVRNIIRKWKLALANTDNDDNDDNSLDKKFIDALNDDMNTPVAIMNLNNGSNLRKHLDFLGFKLEQDVISSEIQALIDQRNEARSNKNWQLADELREKIMASGIVLSDKQ